MNPFSDPTSKVPSTQLKALQRQKRARYLLFFEDHTKGMSARKIAEKHGCNHQTVLNGIFWCEQQALPKLIHRVDRFKTSQTARLLHIQEESLQAWEKSKEPAVTETSSTGGKEGGANSTKTEYQCGNPAYLNTVIKATDKILEIWGAKAHTTETNIIRGENTSAPRPEELLAMARKQLEAMEARINGARIIDVNSSNSSTNNASGNISRSVESTNGQSNGSTHGTNGHQHNGEANGGIVHPDA